jgi:putative intracellular protease/amidase
MRYFTESGFVLIQNNLNMKNLTCAVFIFDGFDDYDVALTMAGLNRAGNVILETFSTKGWPVTSRNGLRVTPQADLRNMDPEDFDLLLLPGGQQWEWGDNLEIFPLIQATVGRRPVIAIGPAALALADLGFLNDVPHTGNFRGYFEQYCPDYEGASLFRSQLCVYAGGILTVNGTILSEPARNMLSLFDTLQEIYATQHEFFDSAHERV